jgi:hypothetical protein
VATTGETARRQRAERRRQRRERAAELDKRRIDADVLTGLAAAGRVVTEKARHAGGQAGELAQAAARSGTEAFRRRAATTAAVGAALGFVALAARKVGASKAKRHVRAE